MIQTFMIRAELDRKLKCRNPVFALEMIQTQWLTKSVLQRGGNWSRNPVFALEMIQTFQEGEIMENILPVCRNPVFALEMIQTAEKPNAETQQKIVAIQYSPWR